MPKPPIRGRRTFNIAEAIQQAVAFHQQGKTSEAQRLYQSVLASRPDHFDALHLLGVLRAEEGRPEEAVRLISHALARQPGSAEAHSNLGNTFAALNRDSEAVACYDKALLLSPRNADVLLNRGFALTKLNRNHEALASYDEVLSSKPSHVDALYNRGVVLVKLERLDEAIASYEKVLAVKPAHAAALYNRGNALARLNRHHEAVASFNGAIALKADHVSALNNLGTSLAELRRYDEAIAAYDRVLAIKADDADAHYNRGAALAKMNRYDDAIASYDRALAIEPDRVNALNNRGVALAKLGRHDEAMKSYDKALAIKPDHIDSLNNRGTSLQAQDRDEQAIQCYGQVLALQPSNVEVLSNRGTALAKLNRPGEAIADYDRALTLKPDHAGALYNRGNALQQLNRHEEAIASYTQALGIQPDHAEALYNRGNVLYALRRRTEAIANYDQALAVRPDYAEALNNRGNVLQELNRHEEAIASFERALAVQSDYRFAYGNAAFSRAHICDWTQRNVLVRKLVEAVRSAQIVSVPFAFVAVSDNPADQLLCAMHFARDRYPAIAPPLWKGERYGHDRIRVAYLSADFHEHATAHLMAGLFEQHDRSRFEITAMSFGPDRQSAMRTRLKGAFERFVDVRRTSSPDIARTLRELEIDIAVDLKGFTTDSRPEIFAHRPAPIQVNYLGYPGTMGVDYIDYIIADEIVIPKEDWPHYSEKVVYLPDCYQVNDSKRAIAERTPTRTEAGLPEQGFVFCSFNSNYKITPVVFDVWMRLLCKIEGSVLWLLEGSSAAAGNLRGEAQARGVDPKRLVFASRVKLAEHLARHRLADLFLDTLPYNAHTTASDALWAGLPVLTCAGSTFAGRVAASLLHAIRLPELVTRSMGEYEALALKLAAEPGQLQAIRDKLAGNRLSAPLFDTDRLRRHIESAYRTMWDVYQRDEAPRPFSIAANGT